MVVEYLSPSPPPQKLHHPPQHTHVNTKPTKILSPSKLAVIHLPLLLQLL